MEQFKESLRKFWGKVVENKDVVIPIGTAVVGALIGAAVTSVIMKSVDVPSFESLVDMEELIA